MANLDLPSLRVAWDPLCDAAMSMAPNTKLDTGTENSNNSNFLASGLLSSLIITSSPVTLERFCVQGEAYIKLAMAIYLLSNNLVDIFDIESSVYRRLFEILDSILAEIPSRCIQALLQSNLSTVRAAFEALIRIAGLLEQRVAFESLAEIGIRNKWLASSAYGHDLLFHAVRMGLDDVVQQLVQNDCRPDGYVVLPRSGKTTAIIEALERHNMPCIQLLLKTCQVNEKFGIYPKVTHFTLFIENTHRLDEMRICQGIKLFLDAGADINSPLGSLGTQRIGEWRGRHEIWSVLDYLFCFHPSVFYRLTLDWNPAHDSYPTRAGILTSLKLGRNTLHGYYTRLEQHVGRACLDQYLELVVMEQLTAQDPWCDHRRRPGEVDLKTVCALVDFGVCMDKIVSRAPYLLANYMEERSECDLVVIRYLLDNGATVSRGALKFASRLQDPGPLAMLIQNIPNIRHQGLPAVVAAANANNFEAVKILIDAGVDVNAEFHTGVRGLRTSLLCRVVALWDSSFEDLRNMIDFLRRRGAKLRLSARRPRLYDLLGYVLRSGSLGKHKGLRKQTVQHIIDAGCDLSDPDVQSARLLEECGRVGEGHDELDRMEIFEAMIRNGTRLRPGAPLAAWIHLGGGPKLAREMLCDGADIDAYYFRPSLSWSWATALQEAANRCNVELVALLLQKGANVNAPARGRWGKTALQAICDLHPHSEAGKAPEQREIINLLVDHGANINAAPARIEGMTALQCAAHWGNLEVIILLLSYDPPADVNAPSCEVPGSPHSRSYGNALDVAAGQGRLDVVKLLLNNGGLSCCPGDTGYDGAIGLAEDKGFLAVAKLMRQHPTAISRSSATRPNLLQPQRDWREYEYDDESSGYIASEWDFDSEDGDSESAASIEEQDPMAQVPIQPDAVEYLGPEQAAPEPGRVWDMDADNSLDFDIGFGDLADDVRSISSLDFDPSTSNMDTGTSDWEFGQGHIAGPMHVTDEVEVGHVYDAGFLW